jgi:SAM-dependent methyltransferase
VYGRKTSRRKQSNSSGPVFSIAGAMPSIEKPSSDTNLEFEPASFRDRNGRVFLKGESLYRTLTQPALDTWEVLSNKEFFKKLMHQGRIVRTERVRPEVIGVQLKNPWVAVLKHQQIPFVSYPYEWTFGMLKDAALLQLDLLSRSLKEGMILKDSSPFNIQWIGDEPVFIDILSFDELHPGDIWPGYRQFCQMFLCPLFLQAYKDIPFQSWLRGNLDGISVENCNQIMSRRDLLRPGVFSHVYLQSKFQAKYAVSEKSVVGELKSAGFNKEMIQRNVAGLKRIVEQLKWSKQQSQWSEYEDCGNYTKEDSDQKLTFVRKSVSFKKWNLVWDLGCNTGAFSRIAAENAHYVLAMDADQLSVERLYRNLKLNAVKNILPLFMNVADASPNLGWRNQERKGLRERGRPNLILCLALIHHMVITNNIPVDDFIRWLSGLGGFLIIEFVSKNDPMVKRLLMNKKDDYYDYELQYFEEHLSSAFKIERRETLGSGNRTLYFAHPRADS